MLSVPSLQLLDKKQQVILISEAANLVALFRQESIKLDI